MRTHRRTSRTRSTVACSICARVRSGSVGTKYTFSSSASAPACSISLAYLIQPPDETPFDGDLKRGPLYLARLELSTGVSLVPQEVPDHSGAVRFGCSRKT